MEYLQHGVEVTYSERGENRSALVYLVDYGNVDNNSFIIANQWTYIECSNKRPDLLIFLNDLPAVWAACWKNWLSKYQNSNMRLKGSIGKH